MKNVIENCLFCGTSRDEHYYLLRADKTMMQLRCIKCGTLTTIDTPTNAATVSIPAFLISDAPTFLENLERLIK